MFNFERKSQLVLSKLKKSKSAVGYQTIDFKKILLLVGRLHIEVHKRCKTILLSKRSIKVASNQHIHCMVVSFSDLHRVFGHLNSSLESSRKIVTANSLRNPKHVHIS